MYNIKAKIFSIVILLSFTQVKAQDYLISFAGIGASTTVDSVKVQNLVQGMELTLNGSDVLNLVLVVGFPETGSAEGKRLTVRPNPFREKGWVEFDAPVGGKVVVTITDVAGRFVLQSEQPVQAGSNAFGVTGLRTGIYSITIQSAVYRFTGKMISAGSGEGNASISNIRDEAKTPVLKAASNTGSVVQMQYNNGEQLLFTGYSGIYSTVVPLVPLQSSTLTFEFLDCTDAEGHHYPVVGIGTQKWMGKNLNVGTMINGTQEQANNATIEKYCYNNDEANCDIYGGLYQWNEMMQYVNTQGVQGICPVGWHIPTDTEWTTLTTFLGGEAIAGGKMKEAGTAHWASPRSGATNSSGFTALPGGLRYTDGSFSYLTIKAWFWSSTEWWPPHAWSRILGRNSENVESYPSGYKLYGFSCRCLQD